MLRIERIKRKYKGSLRRRNRIDRGACEKRMRILPVEIADEDSVAASPYHFTRHLRGEVEGGTPIISEGAAIIRLLQRYSRKLMLSASFAPRISVGAS